MSFDLENYLSFIGYDGPREAGIEALRELHLRQAIAVPFENLDPLLGITPALDAAALQNKLVNSKRGGYCFELNGLFAAALKSLGFKVTGLAARVVWRAGLDGPTQPRTHRLLQIDLDGELWLADVGFGGWTQTAPLRLLPGVEQHTPHEPLRIDIVSQGVYVLSALIRGAWQALYTFSFEPQDEVDYELANYHVATHPASPFVGNLLAARPDTDKRFGLFNNALSIHHRDGSVEEKILTAEELALVLQRDFHVTLPDHPGLAALLERLASETPLP